MPPRKIITVLMLLAAGSARAQIVGFSDDFENGTLTAWSVFKTSGNAVTASDGGAHQGNYGLFIDDRVNVHQSNDEADSVGRDLGNTVGSMYLRAWLRMSGFSGAGNNILITIHGSNSIQTLSELQVQMPGQVLRLRAFDRDSVSTDIPLNRTLADDTWALVEIAAEHVGSANGAARLWLNGELVGNVPRLDWSGVTACCIYLGEALADGELTGRTSLDDIRLSTSPNATTLSLAVPEEVAVSSCAHATVGLVDAEGAHVPAIARAEVAVSVTGAAVYADDTCAAAVAGVTLAQGAASADFYLRATATGTVQLGASSIDFLPGHATVTIIPADRIPGTVTRSAFAWGCSSAEGPAALTGVLLALGLLTRSSRAPRRGGWRS